MKELFFKFVDIPNDVLQIIDRSSFSAQVHGIDERPSLRGSSGSTYEVHTGCA